MEIFARLVDVVTEQPVKNAVVQRFYKSGAPYSDPIYASASGEFNGRVPDREYFWTVTAPGYRDRTVTLEDALHNRPDMPMIVYMDRSDMLPSVTITPKKTNIGLIAVASGIALAWIGKRQKWF